jgi:hypothetical protein
LIFVFSLTIYFIAAQLAFPWVIGLFGLKFLFSWVVWFFKAFEDYFITFCTFAPLESGLAAKSSKNTHEISALGCLSHRAPFSRFSPGPHSIDALPVWIVFKPAARPR